MLISKQESESRFSAFTKFRLDLLEGSRQRVNKRRKQQVPDHDNVTASRSKFKHFVRDLRASTLCRVRKNALMTRDLLRQHAHGAFKEWKAYSCQINALECECRGRSPLKNAELSETAYVTQEDMSTSAV